MEEIRQILAGLDWSPLFISIKTGIAATIVSFFLGIWAARKVLKAKTGLRAVLDGILTLPLVLPPTVAGFFLLLIFSTRRTVGSYLYTTFDIKIVQSWAGCVIAATVIAFPLMYRNARAAFEQVDVNLIYAAQTVYVKDWDVQLIFKGRSVPENVKAIGIRAHDLIPVYGTISGAMLKVKEWKSVDYPFERKYFIQCESGCEDFCWFVQREISATLEEKGMPDALAFPEEKVLFLEG